MCSLDEQSELVTNPPSNIFQFNAALLIVTGNAMYDYKDKLRYVDGKDPLKNSAYRLFTSHHSIPIKSQLV